LFVNLHPRDLEHPSLLDPNAPLAAVAKRVVLEITERASLGGIADVPNRIAQLRALGYRIAIDDLGAGYAGLTSFAVLEPDVVKLDMTLVRDTDTKPTKQKVIASLCGLCHELGMLVVAEGIETPGELACVRELGCDLFQGFALARPGPPFPTTTWPLARTV
jgi:EAL domain-containing protein (putative c-di-GMP-specific phosphodiesterase class I)